MRGLGSDGIQVFASTCITLRDDALQLLYTYLAGEVCNWVKLATYAREGFG